MLWFPDNQEVKYCDWWKWFTSGLGHNEIGALSFINEPSGKKHWGKVMHYKISIT